MKDGNQQKPTSQQQKSKFWTIYVPLSHLRNIKTGEEERRRAINSGGAFIPDSLSLRLGTVLDQDRSTKPGMRTRTAVFLALRTVVPEILHFTLFWFYMNCSKLLLKAKFFIEI